MMKSRVLNIFMNGFHVGRLQKDKSGRLKFTYTPSWLDTPEARPLSLSLPLVATGYTGDSVYNFFENLLPDNPQIRSRIQSKFGVKTNHPFDLLASIGNDCIGAIQVTEEDNPGIFKTITYDPINDEKIAQILKGYQKYPLGMNDDYENFRISIAGAQEKSAFIYQKNQWGIPLGSTPTTHIFKLPIGIIAHQQLDLSDSCENEWLCSRIANAFGFNVAECYIHQFRDVKTLVVKRFDRRISHDHTWIMRLPQEDLCQALGYSSNLKYQSDGGPGINEIMKVLLNSKEPNENRDIFFQAQVLFWLLCAIDGHAKNFSIFIEKSAEYTLTPLYDILSAYPLIAKKNLHERKIKMAMALKGKNTHYNWFEGRRSHFLETAKNSNYSTKRAEYLLDAMLEQVDNAINHVESELPTNFPDHIASPIFAGIKKMKRRLEMT